MGREVRRVPPDWEHPKDHNGRYIPIYDKPYAAMADRWMERLRRWESGEDPNREDAERRFNTRYFWDWDGPPPNRERYRRREWEDDEATHYQLYETTSEGTPISPIFDNLDDLCAWAAENATTFASHTATKEEWLRMLGEGHVYAREGNVTFL